MKKSMIAAVTALLMLTSTTINAEEKSGDKEKVSLIPRVTGMINLRYSYDESRKDEQGFDVRRVRLGMRGNLHEKLDYVMQAEYAGNVRLLDAYLRWKIAPEFNVQVGQFKVHYSMETLGGPANWLTAESPTAVSRLNGYNDLSGLASHKNGRDIGLMFYGGLIHKELFDVLRYRIGVFNGNGYNLKDNNRKKDVAGMLWINPVRQFSITGSYYYGTYGPRNNDHVRNRASAGIEWRDNKLAVRSEYLWGNTAGQHSHGAYAQVAYTVCQMVQPVVSYDFFKQDESVEAYQHNMQVGLNITPVKYVRIQASYIHTLNKGSQNANPKHNNLAEVQVVATY